MGNSPPENVFHLEILLPFLGMTLLLGFWYVRPFSRALFVWSGLVVPLVFILEFALKLFSAPNPDAGTGFSILQIVDELVPFIIFLFPFVLNLIINGVSATKAAFGGRFSEPRGTLSLVLDGFGLAWVTFFEMGM